MKMFYLLVVMILFIDSVASVIEGLKYLERKALIDAHNRGRIDVSTQGSRSASNIIKLSWSKELAATAQTYANKCRYEHSDWVKQHIGENLFISTGNLHKKGVELAVKSWFKERKYYDFSTGKCLQNQFCGHYKQMVYASANKLGCGLQFCPTLERHFWKNVYYVVCHYNKIIMKGKKPYVQGKPCSNCPFGFQKCSKDTENLCLYGRIKRS